MILAAIPSIGYEGMSWTHMEGGEKKGKKNVSMRQTNTDRVGEQTGY